MSNNKKESRKKIRNILMGALSVLPGTTMVTSARDSARDSASDVMKVQGPVELTAIEKAKLEDETACSHKEIFDSRQMVKYATSNGFDKEMIADEELSEKSAAAVDAADRVLVLCDAVLKSLKNFDGSVDSAFASDAWQEPPPVWKFWSSWSAPKCIDSQKSAWLSSIKELQNVQSKLENVAKGLGEFGKKIVDFYSDKKSANNDIAFQGSIIAGVLDNIVQGIETQKSIDVPETGDKAEALAWRKAMQNLRKLKLSTSNDISNCVKSVQDYLKKVKDALERLPQDIEQISVKVEGDLKKAKTEAFMKRLADEKRRKAFDIAKKEEEEKLRKENEEKARVEREKKRKEEEEEREREKAEQERIAREEKEKAEREEQERLAKMREDFDGTRKKLIDSLRDKIEKRKVYWDNITNPSDKTNADIAELLKSKFNVEHEKLDAAGRAKLSEMEAISEFSEDNLAALKELNEYPTQFGKQVSELNSAVGEAQGALIKNKGDLLQFKSDTLDEIETKKSDFTGYVDMLKGKLRAESHDTFMSNIAPTTQSVVSGFDDLKSKLQSIIILLTDKKLDDKIKTIKQSMDALLKKVELSNQNILNQALKIKKDEIVKSLKSKQAIVSENWKKISDYKPSDMPDKLKPYATKCLQAASDKTKSVSQGLKDAVKNVNDYSLTDIDDTSLDQIDIAQSDAVSDHSALINMLCERMTAELERFRADRARMRLWDKIFGNLPVTEVPKDVQRIMEEEGLSKTDAVIKSCAESLPGTEEYASAMVEGLYKPIERNQPEVTVLYCYGPSGIGKTAAVQYIGQATGYTPARVTKETLEKGGEKLAKSLLATQLENSPLFIQIDEADTILAASGSDTARKESTGAFLTFIDTLLAERSKGNVVVVCTSNVAPTALEPAANSRMTRSLQLGSEEHVIAGIAKLLEPVKLNQSMSREAAINDIAGAIRTANLKAQSPSRKLGFRSIKNAILAVCKEALKEKKAAGNGFEQPFEQDEWAPKYEETEADVAIDPERIVQKIVSMI